MLYESYIHPITIISSLPAGQRRRAAGASTYPTPTSVLIAIIGIILLIGIVKKNAIR